MAAHVALKDYIGIAPANGLELAELVEQGLPTGNLDLLKAKGLTFTEMAATVISSHIEASQGARAEPVAGGERTRRPRRLHHRPCREGVRQPRQGPSLASAFE